MRTLMQVYNYFFYKIHLFYNKIGEKDMPGLYAVCIISLIESFNILSLFFIYELVFKVDLNKIEKNYVYVIFFLFFILNYIYFYRRKGKLNIIKEYNSISPDKRKLFNLYFYFYLGSSVAILVILIAIIRNYARTAAGNG